MRRPSFPQGWPQLSECQDGACLMSVRDSAGASRQRTSGWDIIYSQTLPADVQCCSPSLPWEEARGKPEAFAAAGSAALPALRHRSGRQVSTKQACGGERVPFPLLHTSASLAPSLVLASSKRKDSKRNKMHHLRAMLTAPLAAGQPPQERAVSSFTRLLLARCSSVPSQVCNLHRCSYAIIIPISKNWKKPVTELKSCKNTCPQKVVIAVGKRVGNWITSRELPLQVSVYGTCI